MQRPVVLLSAFLAMSALQADEVRFNRDVRPILSNKCWACHGPDAGQRKAELRLDQEPNALASVIVSGRPDQSPLIERIYSTDAATVMPPADHRHRLSNREKQTLFDWIAQGARWQRHWAWLPPKRETGQSIDLLLQRRLRSMGLSYSPPAAGNTLIRRLSFDVRGLPPSPQEVNDFVADTSPEAWQKLVDRFLASPAWGERLAVMWLDLVRYADTNGYHADIEWSVSPYRDYVIQAFNSNMPFDQFTREQIAGDLIPGATLSQKVAAGYNRLNMKSTEFGIQDREYLARYAADRVRTTSGAWLGITLGCAECHDHKFDPLSSRDFYSFAAFFADIKGVGYYPDAQRVGWGDTITVPAPGAAGRLAELRKKLASLDAAVLLSDARHEQTRWKYTTTVPDDGWQKESFNDTSWREGQAGFGAPGTPHSKIGTEWKSSDIWLRREFRVSENPGSVLLDIQHDEDATVYLNGRQVAALKGYSTASADYVTVRLLKDTIKEGINLIAVHCHQTGGGQYIDVGLRVDDPIRAAAEREIMELRKLERTMLATVSVSPRTVRILPRGNWMDETGPVVLPAIPAAFGTIDGRSRLDLADWMTSRRNPLTARVFVNRLWRLFYGTPLTDLEDVGSQGAWPAHPELLDWLAVEFMESGWDIRHMARLMLTAQAYRQSSGSSAELNEVDPQNQLFARQGRFRLDAEFIRDNALAVSGLLVSSVGGPSVKPYQPGGYWENLNFPRRSYQASKGADQYRRGVYTHWQRQFLHPAFLAFDAPSREECTARRQRSNTPLAALVMLNDPTQIESARCLAERTLQQQGEDAKRLLQMFFRVLSRPADAEERSALQELLKEARSNYRADPDAAAELIRVGQQPAIEKLPPVELAAWTTIARVLLNMHETVTRF